jgi:hypothetical protein
MTKEFVCKCSQAIIRVTHTVTSVPFLAFGALSEWGHTRSVWRLRRQIYFSLHPALQPHLRLSVHKYQRWLTLHECKTNIANIWT